MKSFKYDLGKFSRILINAVSGHVFIKLEICKTLKNLFKCSLTDGVVFKLMLLFELFD